MPRLHLLLSFAITLASAGVVAPIFAAPPHPEFVALWRGEPEPALIDSAGSIHFLGTKGVLRTLPLTANGRPFTWRHRPTGLTRWNSEWLVADGTPQVRRFNTSGEFIAAVSAPANISDLVTAGKTLWGANFLATTADSRLWSSTDGRHFRSVPMKDPFEGRFAVTMRSQMVLAGSPAGDLYVAHMIDGPVVHRVYPPARRATWPVAYSRSKRRASRQSVGRSTADDLTSYSLPVRDMMARAGELVVLRNREDVMTPKGVVLEQGFRVDRYGGDGRHVATAVFSESMKWVLRADTEQVTAVTRNGSVRVARWGKPIAGGIVP